MTMKLIMAKANKEDVKEIIAYKNEVGSESDNLLFGGNEFNDTHIEREMASIDFLNSSLTSVMYVGKIDSEIVSIGSLYGRIGRERIDHRAGLAISVKKRYWNQGIATKMIKELINFARDSEKLKIIELEVRTDNIYAIQLYNKLGFEQIGTYRKFFNINDKYYDAILMNLYL